MKTKNLILGVLALLFAVVVNASNSEMSSNFTSTSVTPDEETLFFFVPEDVSSVYIQVSDENDLVFQKVKIYQRGNGHIVCDKSDLENGSYFYTLFVDGKKIDTQELFVRR